MGVISSIIFMFENYIKSLMKKKNVHYFSLALIVYICVLACSGGVGSSSNPSDEKVDLRKASIIAKDFVEEKMGQCDFDDLDYRGGETPVPNRFKVLQKFTNNGNHYVYKIYVQYNGDDWEDINNVSSTNSK